MQFYLMRHGKTKSNEERRYIGLSDESLSELGRSEVKRLGSFPDVEFVFVSILRRSQESARLLFPNAKQHIVKGIEELSFGEFEGKTSAELAKHTAYQPWVDAECTTRCPQGEGLDDIMQRSSEAFHKIVAHALHLKIVPVIVIAHAGSIAALMKQFAQDERGYFDWSVAHTEGWKIELEPETWLEAQTQEPADRQAKFSKFERFERFTL